MRPETSFEPFELFKCCTDLKEQEWRLFDALEIDGCVDVVEKGTDETYVGGELSAMRQSFSRSMGTSLQEDARRSPIAARSILRKRSLHRTERVDRRGSLLEEGKDASGDAAQPLAGFTRNPAAFEGLP